MQTFLPYKNYNESAKVLDNKRLGKQRVECLQILNAINDSNYGWQNHPAVRMWRGYTNALIEYSLAICNEWTNIRGFNDTCADKIIAHYRSGEGIILPRWNIDERIYVSHRSNLLRKDEPFYRQFFKTEPADMPYFWPV
jgi:hypothetical protein